MKEALIGQVPLFASLPESEVHYLAETLQQHEFPAGTFLMREGDSGDHFYLILGGQLEVVKAVGTAEERSLGVRGPGEFLGEMSLLNRDGLRTASVRALTSVTLLEMTRADFDALLHRQPLLAYEMVRVLSMRLQDAENATIHDLQEKNRELTRAYQELQAAHAQIVEKEKLEHELQMAREIQESILPRTLPLLTGFDFGARILPARYVGGDFFDFIPLDEDTVGIVIGDISDKGVPAAIFMALTRSLLRAEASRAATPRETLESVNRHLLDMNEAGMFVTVLYGVLDRMRGEFAYARAGHDLPMVCRADGEILMLDHGIGQPLGIVPTPKLDEQRLRLPRGGMMLLYTDGATDGRDVQGAFFGLERLQGAVVASLCDSAQVLCDRLLDMILAHQGGSVQDDDITLVAVHAASK
jgi:serine phosphatase RsbU (regulator of sigma subunit)